MMLNSNMVPTLEMPKLYEFHFGSTRHFFFKEVHLFHINRLEDARSKLSFPLPPHRKTMHDLIFITRGHSTRSKGMNQYSFHENQFFFLPALQMTAHQSMSEDVEGYFLQFSGKLFIDSMHLLKPFSFLDFNSNPIVSMPEKEVPFVVNILERLLALYTDGKQEENQQLVIYYILALFIEANRHAPIQKNDKKNSAAYITQQFKNALSQYIYTYQSVKEFALFLNLTPNHLNKCVKKTLNTTAQSLLKEMVILEAKSLLKYSDLTISQIAENLCKSTPSNFSRFFKTQTGLSPKEFKNQQ